MELIENIEHNLAFTITILTLLLEAAAAFCILLGFLQIAKIAISNNRKSHRDPFVQIRLMFGKWLILALELQLGADILATTGNPQFSDLGKLAAIAVIRTFLNYFLYQELNEELKRKQQSLNQSSSTDPS